MPHPERVFRSVADELASARMGRSLAMAAHVPQCARVGGLMDAVADPRSACERVLWLPLSFFIWFVFASPLVWPVMQMAKLVPAVGLAAAVLAIVGRRTDTAWKSTTRAARSTRSRPDGRSGIGELVLISESAALRLFVAAVHRPGHGDAAHDAAASAAIRDCALRDLAGAGIRRRRRKLKMLAFDSGSPGANAVDGRGIRRTDRAGLSIRLSDPARRGAGGALDRPESSTSSSP